MPRIPSGLRGPIILFFSLSGLLQLYWLASVSFPFLYPYYPYGFVAHALFYVAEFGLLCFYVRNVKRKSLYDLGFRRLDGWKANVELGFALAIFHNVVNLAISSTIIGLKLGYVLPIYVYVPVYFAMYLLISVSEEGVFRGCILGQLLRKYGATAAIIVSSMLFGIYHIYYIPLILSRELSEVIFQASYAFQSFTAGLFLAYFYYKTDRNLLGPTSYHFSQMFFNVPFLWTEAPLGTQIASHQVSSALNIIQILMIMRMKSH